MKGGLVIVICLFGSLKCICQNDDVAHLKNFPSTRVASTRTVAHVWIDALLKAIRLDKARPTVNARTLFHLSVVMYDAWAAYGFGNNGPVQTFFLGRTVGNYFCPFFGVPKPADIEAARREAISYAAYQFLSYRYEVPNGTSTQREIFRALLDSLGYDPSYLGFDYTNGGPPDFGNYLGYRLKEFSHDNGGDGANEENSYQNTFYKPVNASIVVDSIGNPMNDPNRWQPIKFTKGCIDQNGHPCLPTQIFLSAEWGNVVPFALKDSVLKNLPRDSHTYHVYYDPGPPPKIGAGPAPGLGNDFIWSFALVLAWSSHLDPSDGTLIDISPASIGNNDPSSYPTTIPDLRSFYNFMGGGDLGTGYSVNPKTGQAYQQQIIPRGDFARVLAEFWADGPNSETPPGHWFTLLNYVNTRLAEKRWRGNGPILSDLEWDVKSYLTLGGAMHDAAVSAWSIKGYYDAVRPVSAIRYMAAMGQSSDDLLPRYHPSGLPLIPGLIELVGAGDPLAGASDQNVNKIKVFTWKGPGYITTPATQTAGVGWILAEKWYPYQRPTFVTPPFAGYISGHSTYSSAAAEVLSLITGDEYFPGGIGEFATTKNSYLVFEDGPSVNVTLQWAKYKDAADQSALSRIWGGIHPPFDDMPGRRIGKSVGLGAVRMAESLFTGSIVDGLEENPSELKIYPNPVLGGNDLFVVNMESNRPIRLEIMDLLGKTVLISEKAIADQKSMSVNTAGLPAGIYFVRVSEDVRSQSFKIVIK